MSKILNKKKKANLGTLLRLMPQVGKEELQMTVLLLSDFKLGEKYSTES